MLKIENISKTYGDKKIKAVDNIHFEVKPGEIFGFVGPNGAGKTTTIKMIVTLLRPDSGRILINGVDNSQDKMCIRDSCKLVYEWVKANGGVPGMEAINKEKSAKLYNFLDNSACLLLHI